jgi:hypothetical protein
MRYSEYYCVGCREEHDASAWWRRPSPNGAWEYLCGQEYTALKDNDKLTWEHFKSN